MTEGPARHRTPRIVSYMWARGPIRPVLACGLLTMLVLMGLTAIVIVELREREVDDARRQLIAFDILVGEQTTRAIQSVELVINDIADELQMTGVGTAAEFDALRGNPLIYQRLHQKIGNIPLLDAITLDGADGRLVNFSRYFPIPDVSIADRQYFQTMRDDPSRTTMISEPVRNRGDGVWNIYLARRITGQRGEFIGVVLGAMRVDYFESLYESVSMAGGTSIGLWRQDGILLARFPRIETALGQRFPQKAHFAAMASGETAVAADARDVDGLPRMIASRLLPHEAIVVEASQTRTEVLADWRHDAVVIALSGLACTMAAGLLVWALVRQFATYEAMAGAVASREDAVRGRQRAEARLLVAQKMEAIGRITSGVAHDFNNLLTSIIANAELMQRAPADQLAGSRRISTILQAADRGAALVRQLLAFSRQQVLEPARVDIGALLRGMTELMGSALGASLHVRVKIPDNLWPALVDPVQFENMILNLAINARDAQEGSGEVVIACANMLAEQGDRPADLADGDFVMISVIDCGTGMSAEVLHNVFEPFFTTKPLGRGSGLGLSQVYGVARQSGGTVRISSEPGVGTTVEVFLPRAGRGEVAAAQMPETAFDHAGRVVLLVDDDRPVRETVAETLAELGFTVDSCESGEAALRRLGDGLVPDVLLVDRFMPGLDGPELAAIVRARLPGLPVVFMTGDTAGDDLAGESFVIAKPFLARSIVAMLQAALKARSAVAHQSAASA